MVVADDVGHAAQAAGDQAVEEPAPVDLRLGQRARHAQEPAPAVGIDADRRQHRRVADHAALADPLVAGVEDEVGAGAEAPRSRSRQARSSSSSRAAARLTWVEDRPSRPNSAMTRAASRVDTPLTYISATASITARHDRRPRSRACG